MFVIGSIIYKNIIDSGVTLHVTLKENYFSTLNKSNHDINSHNDRYRSYIGVQFMCS